MWISSLSQEDPLEKWHHTPVFLLGKFHEQRSLVNYSPCGCKQSDTAEYTHRFFIAQRLAYYILFIHTLILHFHYPCTFSIVYRLCFSKGHCCHAGGRISCVHCPLTCSFLAPTFLPTKCQECLPVIFNYCVCFLCSSLLPLQSSHSVIPFYNWWPRCIL